jgi:hypothetical protein
LPAQPGAKRETSEHSVSHLNTAPFSVATWCVGLLRAAADTLASGSENMSPPAQPPTPRPTGSTTAREAGAGAVTTLVYELLDAHDDTARMASEFELDPRWQAHLDYLRALQRKGRETLAHLELDRRP